MADGPSAEDATANELGDDDTCVTTRERHKRLDASMPGIFSATVQDAAKRVLDNVSADDHRRPPHDRRVIRQQHEQQRHYPSRQSHRHHTPHCNHYHYNLHRHHHLTNHRNNDRVINNDGDGGGSSGGGSDGVTTTTTTTSSGDSLLRVDAIGAASDEESSIGGVEALSGGNDGIKIVGVDEVDGDDEDDGVDSECGDDSAGGSMSAGAGGVMTGRSSNNNAENDAPEVNDAVSRVKRASVVVVREPDQTKDEAAKTDGGGRRHHQDSPFKGQVRMAEDTLVGPCGKKRCADRYDSSESSDSGVAVSCGECSSSGTSDITEPGSPCSTSSDEGVAIRGTSASPLPSLPKLAASSQAGTRPQWPWAPPLAATACSTYKRSRGEPEAGALARSGAADPTSRGAAKGNGKTAGGQHHHESQGKITEYFKTQIKPQQPKIKKTSETMSVLVAKSSPEFRRPPMVQRNKGGLAKYLGTVSLNTRGSPSNDWEARTLTTTPSAAKKPPLVIVPRITGKLDHKKLPKPLPSLPISNDVLKNLPSCKISSLRLPSDASLSTAKCSSPPSTAASSLLGEPVPLDFKGCILSKPHVNENNNLTNGGILSALRSQGGHDPMSRLLPPENGKNEEAQAIAPVDEDDVDEEEEDSRGSSSKPSPILSAPITIRFPAREPEKDRSRAADSGNCRWDKCEVSFESVGGLLEHLQSAHINTQTGVDNFVCQWQGCKVQGRTSCSRRWLERHVLSHGGNKPFRCIVDGCGCRFSSQTALERHVNGHFNQPETNSNNGRRSCENGGKLVRRNGKKLRYRRQPWSARVFDYFDSGVMERLQHRLLALESSRTLGGLADTPANSMALTSQILMRRVEMDGKTKVLLRWFPQNIVPDEWVLESEVQSTKHVGIRKVAASNPEEVGLALYPAISGHAPPTTRVKQRRKPVKNS
ncbi:PREDICTED: uncharacterized protein LOC106742067 [Dinoponera quadriceps]|uniref:Uncharacterized protein LOC106742067 n=1 Tax=Dinoponera quadriceps TaxID=609295 RepID=A0A6P3WVS6_DINQU|nr:PREDICTED: uncharacterized protein LOC106742067 [Dinoponera quadriceps]